MEVNAFSGGRNFKRLCGRAQSLARKLWRESWHAFCEVKICLDIDGKGIYTERVNIERREVRIMEAERQAVLRSRVREMRESELRIVLFALIAGSELQDAIDIGASYAEDRATIEERRALYREMNCRAHV